MHPKGRNLKTACSNFLLICLYFRRLNYFFVNDAAREPTPISRQLSIKHPCNIENVYEGTESSCDAMCLMLSMWLSKENCCSSFHRYKLDYLDLIEDIFTDIVPA